MTQSIAKELSRNDTGETGTHQVGFHIPKEDSILSFFPSLNPKVKNPRIVLFFKDDFGKTWQFPFIYYNNKFFGGTRNEYRLTSVTEFVRAHGLHSGDEIVFERVGDGELRIRFRRSKPAPSITNGILRLGNGWRVISY